MGYDIEKEKREAIEAGRRALNSLQTAKENLNSGVIKYRYVIMVLFLIATMFCGYSRNLIKVDYDMNDYLPETSPSTVSIYILLS